MVLRLLACLLACFQTRSEDELELALTSNLLIYSLLGLKLCYVQWSFGVGYLDVYYSATTYQDEASKSLDDAHWSLRGVSYLPIRLAASSMLSLLVVVLVVLLVLLLVVLLVVLLLVVLLLLVLVVVVVVLLVVMVVVLLP